MPTDRTVVKVQSLFEQRQVASGRNHQGMAELPFRPERGCVVLDQPQNVPSAGRIRYVDQ